MERKHRARSCLGVGKSVPSAHVVLHFPCGMQTPGPVEQGAGSPWGSEPRAGDVGGAGRVSGRTAAGERSP